MDTTGYPPKPYMYDAFVPTAKQIRLIHVHRDESGTIHCDLTTFDLQALPEYFCLSYTWGTPTPVRKITINDGFLDVRQNLFDFLKGYYLQPHEYIWIDQISIDQSNIHERGHQVGNMAKIFKQAAYVIIWLGNERGYYKIARDLIVPIGVTRSKKMASMTVITQNAYFTRVWVVQEFILARE
jgi:hypothetical protein